jgi:GH18 family chitinase
VFDTPKRIKQKVRLALEMGHGGVHFWELGQDHIDAEHGPGGIMLQAVLDAHQEYTDETASAADSSDDEL